MSTEFVVITIVGALIGGPGLVGLIAYYLKRSIDKRLKAKEAHDQELHEQRVRRRQINDEWDHEIGRMFFFVHKAIVSGPDSVKSDIGKVWEDFQKAEEHKKSFDREILAKYIED